MSNEVALQLGGTALRLHQNTVGKNKRRDVVIQKSLLILAVTLFLAGSGLSLYTWESAHLANTHAAKLIAVANKAYGGSPAVLKTTAPSTIKPSSTAVASYTVPTQFPKYLNIPSLGVHARVLSLGTLSSGALATPSNIYDVGWYNKSAEPGQPGATLIDGHVSSWTAHGVFYGIKNLKAGDSIQVVRGDNTVYNYQVVATKIYPAGNVDMSNAVMPIDSTKAGLNLITCSGDVIPGTNEFNERVIVFASQT